MAWTGLNAPARTPAPVVAKIAGRWPQASPEFRERLRPEGPDPAGGPPGQCPRFLRSEIEKWRKVIAFAGVKPE